MQLLELLARHAQHGLGASIEIGEHAIEVDEQARHQVFLSKWRQLRPASTAWRRPVGTQSKANGAAVRVIGRLSVATSGGSSRSSQGHHEHCAQIGPCSRRVASCRSSGADDPAAGGSQRL